MISPYQVLQESGFSQYTAMVRFTYDRENTSLGAEKLAEMVRAIPGSTRVTTVSLDKDRGIAIFSVKLISAKTPKAAFCSFKENALRKFKGMLLKVEIGAGTIEKKGDFILMKEEKRSNLSTCIGQLIAEGLLLEVSIEELNRQYVESGKLPKRVFDHIVSVCNNQSNYATWLCKRIADGVCSEDAIDTWGERFEFFNQYKQRFQTKDINQLKTREQIENWVQNELNPVARDVFKKGISGGSPIQDDLIEKLEKCRVSDFKSKLTDREYYVFRLGGNDFDVEHYLGSGTTWCTRNNKNTYLGYYNRRDIHGTSGDYWIFVNKNNPQEKWQLLFKANYFCNRKDVSFLRERSMVPVEMLKFLRDKYNQQFDSSVQDNIKWLEDTVLNAEDDNSAPNETVDLNQYLIGTESSFKAYQLPYGEINAILTQLGLAKNTRVAQAVVDELDNRPIAVILNTGSKKAEPLFIASTGGGYLVQAEDNSLKFELLKNENEYKLLRQIGERTNKGIIDRVHATWDPNLPNLSEFRYEGRNDVWKFSSRENQGRNLMKASLQLANLAASVTTATARPDADSLLLEALRDGSNDIYAVRIGHWVGLVLPPGVSYNRCVDTDILLYAYGDTTSILPGFKEKLDRVGIPVHFEEAGENSDTLSAHRRSNLFVACYAQNFTTFDSLDRFKVTSSIPDANEKWDIYRIPDIVSRALFGTSYEKVCLRYRGGEDHTLVSFEGRAGYTHIVTLNSEGRWESEPARTATSTFRYLGIRTRGDNAAEEIGLLDQVLQGFNMNLHRNSRYRRYLPDPDQIQRQRGSGVPSYLRTHWDELQPVEVPWSRRGTVTSQHGTKLTWNEAQDTLRASSPGTVNQIERIAQELTLLDVTIYLNTNAMSDWNCLVRFVDEDRKVVKVVSRTGTGAGLVWRVVDISERNQITVDENGNRVDTAPPARQPRQPRAIAAPANGEAPQQAPADFNTEGLQQFQVTTQNATDAYRASGENAQRLLEVAGFTNFAQSVELYREQGVQIHTVIYRICPHRGAHATWAAILFADGRGTTVGSIPNNPTLQIAAAHSSNWRQLTRELDNSIASFQQLYNICEELHIPQTVAIQHWPNNRANR